MSTNTNSSNVLRQRVLILLSLSLSVAIVIIYVSFDGSWQQKFRLAPHLISEFIVKSNFSPKNLAGITTTVTTVTTKLVNHRNIYKPTTTTGRNSNTSKEKNSWKWIKEHAMTPPPFTLNSTIPKILLWTWTSTPPPLHSLVGGSFLVDSTILDDCSAKCEFSYDKLQLNISDAVIFHIPSIRSAAFGLPSFHHPEQIWVFQCRESPSTEDFDLSPYKNMFNWTMTYRTDSEVFHQTRILRRINPEDTAKTESSGLTDARIQSLINKPKLVAWIVSHCNTPSNRESFVRQLQKFIPVDVYGNCGTLSCRDNPNTHPRRDCYRHVATQYKFYLSFENSLCTDYVTEKFFLPLNFDMIPVVYGRANYTAIAPPNSFIDTDSFRNAEELANYLKYLNSHDKEYLKYFEWKQNYYHIKIGHMGYCHLCTKLTFDVGEGRRHIYKDIGKWWKNESKGSSGDAEKLACLPRPSFN